MSNDTIFEGWAQVELLGHRTFSGMAREIELCGVRMLRLDIALPEGDPGCTQFYPAQAIYCITPMNEEQVDRLRSNNLTSLQMIGLRAWPDEIPF